MLRIVALLSVFVLVACEREADNEACLQFAATGDWPQGQENQTKVMWPFSFKDFLGLEHGETPLEICNQLDGFDQQSSYQHAQIETRFEGLYAPQEIDFDGQAKWPGSGDVVDVSIDAFFSAPPSGSQLVQFEFSFFFVEFPHDPVVYDVFLDDVVAYAVRQFGPFAESQVNAQGRKKYLWVIDEDKVLESWSEEQCSVDRLSLINYDALIAVENPCSGFVELYVDHREDTNKSVNYLTFIVEDRDRIVGTALIDHEAADSLSE